jgi:hypothetical protein
VLSDDDAGLGLMSEGCENRKRRFNFISVKRASDVHGLESLLRIIANVCLLVRKFKTGLHHQGY